MESKGVDNEVLASDGELDQADLFKIAVQTVGLGIKRNPSDPPDTPDQFLERSGFANVNVIFRLW